MKGLSNQLLKHKDCNMIGETSKVIEEVTALVFGVFCYGLMLWVDRNAKSVVYM